MKNQSPTLQEMIDAVTKVFKQDNFKQPGGVSTLPLQKENLLDIKIKAKMNERRRFLMNKMKG